MTIITVPFVKRTNILFMATILNDQTSTVYYWFTGKKEYRRVDYRYNGGWESIPAENFGIHPLTDVEFTYLMLKYAGA